MRISQRDVARHLGVSNATISRALRLDPCIPARTRRRVEAACKELGYEPNPILSELAASRWKAAAALRATTLAFIICSRNREQADFFLPHLRRHAADLGYRLELFDRTDFESAAKLERRLRTLGLTNLILSRSDEREFMVKLNWKKFISVQLLPGFFSQPLHSVVVNHFSAVMLNWRQVVSHGYRRIGITLIDHRPMELMDDVVRASAVYACQTRLFPEFAVIPPFLYQPDNVRAKDFSKWVKRYEPDAIIGFNPTHHILFSSLFNRSIPYACLYQFPTNSIEYAGTAIQAETCSREAIALLHFCRRTYQWGVPKNRIDHVIEPLWSEGNSLPWKEPRGEKRRKKKSQAVT